MEPQWSLDPGDAGLVSIVVTAYNQERFLRQAIGSIITQTYRPIEGIIIDDGSTDATAKVVSEYARHGDEKLGVRYFYQQNQGAQAARNRGVALARGEYIQYLDGDDVLGREKIAAQVDFLSSKEGQTYDAAFGDANFLVPDDEDFRLGDKIGMGATDDFLVSLLTGAWNPNFSYLCRRLAVQGCGPWDQAIAINQDYEYFLRMACRGGRFAYVPVLTGAYRKHVHTRISEKPMIHRARATLAILQSAEKAAQTAQTLTAARRVAFARAYRRVSYWCFGLDNPSWQASLGAAVRLCPDLMPQSALGRLLQKLLGVWATETLLGMGRSCKRRVYEARSIKPDLSSISPVSPPRQ